MSRASTLATFKRTMALIGSGASQSEVLDAIVRMAEAEDPAILCSILLLDESGKRLNHGAAPSLPAFYSAAIDGVEIGPSVGSCGTAVFLNQRVIVEDIATDPLWANFKDLAGQAGLASCWSEPLRLAGGEVVGSFAIYRRQPSRPSAEDLDFIEAAAELAALGIDRSRVEARARQAAERESEVFAELKAFFEITPDLLCITDAKARVLRINAAWTEVLGWPAEELIGRSYLDLIHPEDLDATISQGRHLTGGSDVVRFRNRYRHADGGYRVLEWRARLSDDRVYAAARDVTEAARAEAEMAAARDEAERANQAKSDFLANMSHEIRTPLNGVIGVVDALARTGLDAAQREMVDLIRESGEALTRLVSDVLDLSKIEAGRLELEDEVFDLADAFGGALAMARLNTQAKGLGFSAEFGPSAQGRFHGDGVRLRQVLGNLLSNAVKFTESGDIRVRIDVEPGDGDQARLVCVVEDTGVGFDPDDAHRLFQRFSQADTTVTRRFGGSGLGLSICAALVGMMGGEISAESRAGEGSVFRFAVPLRRHEGPPAEADAPAAGAPLAAPQRSLQVLLAEDHPANQKVVQLLLSPFDIDLTTVENGARAVEAARGGGFDLILMDIQMPVMDGLTATREIRDWERVAGGRTPIVVLSANAMSHHMREAIAAGADLHVPKPLTGASLLAGIEQVLAPRAA